jgi:hypothetical protein
MSKNQEGLIKAADGKFSKEFLNFVYNKRSFVPQYAKRDKSQVQASLIKPVYANFYIFPPTSIFFDPSFRVNNKDVIIPHDVIDVPLYFTILKVKHLGSKTYLPFTSVDKNFVYYAKENKIFRDIFMRKLTRNKGYGITVVWNRFISSGPYPQYGNFNETYQIMKRFIMKALLLDINRVSKRFQKHYVTFVFNNMQQNESEVTDYEHELVR